MCPENKAAEKPSHDALYLHVTKWPEEGDVYSQIEMIFFSSPAFILRQAKCLPRFCRYRFIYLGETCY